MFLLFLIPPVLARGPPGMRPPASFDAETWYPSNLPTVMPPWKMPGADISQFRTPSPPEFTDNSVTAPFLTTTAAPSSKTTTSLEFQTEDEATVILGNSTSSAEVMETATTLKSSENVTSAEFFEEAMNSTVVITTSIVENKETSGELQNLVAKKNEEFEEEKGEPFHGSESIFELLEKEATNSTKVCSDLVFVIDSSGNVLSQYEKQKELVRLILQALVGQKRRLGLMTYAGRKRQRWNIPPRLNVTKEMYLKKLKKSRFLGGVTTTGAALKFLTLDEELAPFSTVVLVTDGFSFDDVDEPARELREQRSIEIFATGDYFPLLRDVLTVITGSPSRVRFGHKEIRKLIEDLRC